MLHDIQAGIQRKYAWCRSILCDVAGGLKNLVYGKSFACGKIATEVVGAFLFVNWGGLELPRGGTTLPI